MTEIALQQPVVEYKKNSLVFLATPSYEQAESTVNTLLTMEGAVNHWIGDAILYLEAAFPNTYTQFFPDGYKAKSLANMRWVSKRVPPSRRREGLSWSIHEAVAGLDNPDDQDEALETAALNDMTVSETRKMVRAIKGKPEPVKEPKIIHVCCEQCGHEFEVTE